MNKRLISLFLAVVICCSVLTSCDLWNKIVGQGTEQTEQPDAGSGTGENNGEQNPGNSDEGGEGKTEEEIVLDETVLAELAAIQVPERFKQIYTIDNSKLQLAAEVATAKLKAFAKDHGIGFIGTSSTNYKYTSSTNNNWTCGMYTGCYLMAYQLTGDKWFSNIVNNHMVSYVQRQENKVGMDDHDVGFVFVPSCVGAYKLFSMDYAKEAVRKAVEYYYDTSYSKEGGFIIRSHKSWDSGGGCRTMIDSMMNASLFFWAGQEYGNEAYTEAGLKHTLTTVDLIVRDDGSTYHHYQFDPETAEPLYGLTWQGYSDESCWSRGHSWGIYGFSIAYSYTKNQQIMDAQRDVTYYMLNHLPDDLIPYWDYTFTEGDEPRDSSAAAIAVCGMLDMASYLPKGSAQRVIYESAAAQIMESLIDNCTTNIGVDYDGLIHSVTHGKPQNLSIEECAPYADYFYLEALARYLNHDFVRPW